MKRILFVGSVLAISGLIYSWFVYEDMRFPWQSPVGFETRHPGCVPGLISGDYASLTLPTGFKNFYLAWGDNFPAGEIEKAVMGKAILVLTWEPYVKSSPGRSLLEDISSGKYDVYMADMASAIGNYGHPVMLRWGHEPNGDWYAWSGASNGRKPEIYIKAWRRMAATIRAGAGPKVRLIFSVNGEDKPGENWNRFENYYPGGEYIDAVGLDVYNWGDSREWSSWRRPNILLKGPYSRALAMAPDKPVFLTEVATCPDKGSAKARWMSRLFYKLETRYTAVKGFMWFDYDKECDWRLSSDRAASDSYAGMVARDYFKAEGTRLNWFFGE